MIQFKPSQNQSRTGERKDGYAVLYSGADTEWRYSLVFKDEGENLRRYDRESRSDRLSRSYVTHRLLYAVVLVKAVNATKPPLTAQANGGGISFSSLPSHKIFL
jgi:hypothetical protein